MDSKEKHIRENEPVNDNMIANSLRAKGRKRKRESIRKINGLWLWLGILVLIAILIYWLFSIGIIGSLTDSFNG